MSRAANWPRNLASNLCLDYTCASARGGPPAVMIAALQNDFLSEG